MITGRLAKVLQAFQSRKVYQPVKLFGKFGRGRISAKNKPHNMPETPLDNIIVLYMVFGEYH
jgi:hypothetical protein